MHISIVSLFATPPPGYGGVERIAAWTIEEYLKKGLKVTLISHYPCSAFSEFKNFSAVVMPLETLDFRPYVPKDVDIIHVHNQFPEAYLSQEAPILATCHTIRPGFDRHYDNTVFVSQSHARDYGGKDYVYNAVKVDEIPFYPQKERYFSFLAQVKYKSKNMATAINMAFDLNLPLHFAGGELIEARGSWAFKYFLSAQKRKLLTGKGIITGQKKFEHIGRSFALFYLTAFIEPFGIATHEALATGTPILGSPNGAIPEFIDPGKNGFIVHNYQEAKEKLLEIYDIYQSQPQATAEFCRSSAFKIEDCANSYLNFYEKIINNNGRLYSPTEQPQFKYNPPQRIKIRKPGSF